MPKRLFKYQLDWINSTARHKIWKKSRRIGATFSEALWSFRRRLTTPIDHVFSSSNITVGKEFLMYVKKFAHIYNITLGEEYIKEGEITKEIITFPNRSRIIVVSSSPDAFRGMAGDCTLDEFAIAQDPEELYTAAQPITKWKNGHLHIISTEKGQGTLFFELCKKAQNKENLFEFHQTTFIDALNDGLAERMKGDQWSSLPTKTERAKALLEFTKQEVLSDAQFNQEFMCIAMGSNGLISEESYDKCIIPNFELIRDKWAIDLNNANPIYIGIDVAVSGDQTCIWAVEQGTDKKQINNTLKTVYRTVFVKYIKNMALPAQYQNILAIIKHPKIKKVLIDCLGIGTQLSSDLSRDFPNKVFGFVTTHSRKENICERVSGFVAGERVSLPADKEIREDILAMQRRIRADGFVKYEGRTASSHSDAFSALSFALEAAEADTTHFDYLKV